jgi:hypothetical protein
MTCRTFSIIPPSIKLCAHQSFRTSDFRENVINRVAQLSRLHSLMDGFQKRLLVRGRSGLGRLDHVHDGFRQSLQKNQQDARFEGEKKTRQEIVKCNEGEDSYSEGTDDAKDEEPRYLPLLNRQILMD